MDKKQNGRKYQCIKYWKVWLCAGLSIGLLMTSVTLVYAGAADTVPFVITEEGHTPPKDATIIHILNDKNEKPYTKAANVVSELTVGESHRFTVAANQRTKVAVTWQSSNPEVAQIDKITGELKALSAGTATITLCDTINAVESKYELTVKEKENLPELPKEWYTVINSPSDIWSGEKGVAIVLKKEYASQLAEVTEMSIPEKINGKKVVVILRHKKGYTRWNLEELGFTSIKRVQCSYTLSYHCRDVKTLENIIFNDTPEEMYWSKKLKDLDIPEGVRKISSGYFYEGQQSVRIPASIIELQEHEYSDLSHPNVDIEYIVDGNNEQYYSIFGSLFRYPHEKYATINGKKYYYNTTDKKFTLVRHASKKNESIYYVPYGTEKVVLGAFYNNSNLKKIVLPDSVTELGALAFGKIIQDIEIVIPASVVKIHPDAFIYNDYDSVEHITIIAPVGSAAEVFAIEHNIPYRNE